MSKKPFISIKKKVCIICEGYEEYEYLEKLLDLNVWNALYEFKLINAESNGKIPARYNDAYMNNSYDIILIFCDTDDKPFETYKIIKQKIDNIHGIESSSDNITIFANPCTMQIILLHFSNIRLISHKKVDNGNFIKEYTGMSGYRAKKKQRDILFSKITSENYYVMVANSKTLPTDDTVIGSSNFSMFIDNFSNNEIKWIDDINSLLEE